MSAPCFIAYNSASGSASTSSAAPLALASQSTGTSVHTMLQIKPGTPKIRVIGWGYCFDTPPTAVVKVSLVTTGTVFATLNTALAAGDIMKYNDVTGAASQAVTGSTSASAFYTGSTDTESSISANTMNYLADRNELGQSYERDFALGREPEVNGGTSLRVVATTATAVNMLCWIIWEE